MKKLSMTILILCLTAFGGFVSCTSSGGSDGPSGNSIYPTCGTTLTGGNQSDLVGTWTSDANNPSYDFPNEIFTLNADGTCTANWVCNNGSLCSGGGPCWIDTTFNVVLWSMSGNTLTFKHGSYSMDINGQQTFWAPWVITYWWEIKSSSTNTLSLQLNTVNGQPSYIYSNGNFTCMEPGVSSRIVSGNPSLVSILVTPINPIGWIGTVNSTQFSATGVYSDNSTQNLTNQVTWASSDTAKVTINNNGLATGIAAGTVTITGTSGSVSGSTTLTIHPVLVSVTITPGGPIISKGSTLQFTATGTYNDGTTKDLTSTIMWFSTNASIATFSTVTPGLATAVNTGAVEIKAASNVSGSTWLNVI